MSKGASLFFLKGVYTPANRESFYQHKTEVNCTTLVLNTFINNLGTFSYHQNVLLMPFFKKRIQYVVFHLSPDSYFLLPLTCT